MLIRDNGKTAYVKTNNPTVIKRTKLPLTNLNNQCRNYNNKLIKEKSLKKPYIH